MRPMPTLRRLPVFIVVDDSAALAGTLGVTAEAGLALLRHELSGQTTIADQLFLGVIRAGERAQVDPLTPLDLFVPPRLNTVGPAQLAPALDALAEALRYDLILPTPGRPGDLTPLVFVILARPPHDDWPAAAERLAARARLRPHCIVLVAEPGATRAALPLSNEVFTLRDGDATHLSNYFAWIVQAIVTIAQAQLRGDPAIVLPALPPGIVPAR